MTINISIKGEYGYTEEAWKSSWTRFQVKSRGQHAAKKFYYITVTVIFLPFRQNLSCGRAKSTFRCFQMRHGQQVFPDHVLYRRV